jgi:hypothetical protein
VWGREEVWAHRGDPVALHFGEECTHGAFLEVGYRHPGGGSDRLHLCASCLLRLTEHYASTIAVRRTSGFHVPVGPQEEWVKLPSGHPDGTGFAAAIAWLRTYFPAEYNNLTDEQKTYDDTYQVRQEHREALYEQRRRKRPGRQRG